MNFESATLESIRSVSQRALATYWDRLAAGRRFPAFKEFRPDPGLHDPNQLVVWDVEGEGKNRKFRAQYQGENVAQAFNSAWAGMTMDQVVPMSLRRLALGAANECVASGCLVYAIFSTMGADDQRVNCDRLLLPFGLDGSKVEQIIGSLQLSNMKVRHKILKHFEMHTDEIFLGKISASIRKSGPMTAGERVTPGEAAAATAEYRRAARRDVRLAAKISFAGKTTTCMVRNISATGAAIEAVNVAAIPDSFALMIEMESAERHCTVAWRRKARLGVRFS